MPTFLGLDLGTNALKAGLFDEAGRASLIVRYAYPMQRSAGGAAVQNPEAWWAAVCRAIAELRGNEPAAAIDGICVIGQGPTLVVCDDGLLPHAPALTWADQRDHAERLRLSERLGYAVSTYSLLPRVSWLTHAHPDAFSARARVVQAYDFIAARLVDHAFAAQFGPWPPFDAGEFERAGLDPVWIPPIVPMGAPVGETTAPWCVEAHLPAGIPVFAGVYDAIATTLGVALVEPGRACDYGGGSGGYGLCWESALTGEGIGWWPGLCANQYIAGGATAGAGQAVEWFARTIGEDASFNTLMTQASRLSPGAGGLHFLPYLMGERSPLWDDRLRGAFVGLTHQHGRAYLARAVLEGVAFGVRNIARVVESAGGILSELRVCGGTARYELLNQIKADVLGVPVLVPEVSEASLLGAAMIAAVGVGVHADYASAAHEMVHIQREIPPDSSHRAAYDEGFERFRGLTGLRLGS